MQDDDQTWMGGDDENYTIAEPDRIVRGILYNNCNNTYLFINDANETDPTT